MRIEPFRMERWQSTYENEVEINLADSGVAPMTIVELVSEAGIPDLMGHRLVYTQSNGTRPLRDAIAGLYEFAPDVEGVDNGEIEAPAKNGQPDLELASRKLAVTAAAGAAAATGAVEITLPVAIVAAAVYHWSGNCGHLGQLRQLRHDMGVNGIIHKQGVIAQARLARANRLDMGREAIALPVH